MRRRLESGSVMGTGEDAGDDARTGSVTAQEVIRCISGDRDRAHIIDAEFDESREDEIGRGSSSQFRGWAQREVDERCPVQRLKKEYRDELSPASLLSLELQGGPMSQEELTAFEVGPYSEAACRVRRWDDAAKEPGLEVPSLESYRGLLESLVR